MGRITKLIMVVVIVGIIFCYRDDITDHLVAYRFGGGDDPVTLGIQHAQQARDAGDFDLSLLLLNNLEKDEAGSEQGEESKGRDLSRRHKAIYCEQAILYKKIGMKHLQEGNILRYNEYILLSADKLQLCAGGIKDLQ